MSAVFHTMPIGIDIGATRVRLALAEARTDGSARVRAVLGRDLPEGAASSAEIFEPELLAAVIEDALAEFGVKERRCVVALGSPDAALRIVRFPTMSWAERVHAARFEAMRFAPWNIKNEPSCIRVHPVDRASGLYAVGAVRRRVLDSRVTALKLVGLKAITVEHDALTLRRAFPHADAVLDVGAERSTLHVFGAAGVLAWPVALGGMSVTRGIAHDLSIDLATAERRKRILGTAGAGIDAYTILVHELTMLIDRARMRTEIMCVAATGNGIRLPKLLADLSRASGIAVEVFVADSLRSDAYHDDVLRNAAPDWAMASALAIGSAA